jgi:hypothetical protein
MKRVAALGFSWCIVAAMTSYTPSDQLTDVGPAAPPPAWCAPDARPRWEQLTDGGTVCAWERSVSDDVWISAEDRLVGLRVMRSAPRIFYWEPPVDGVTPAAARQLARHLMTAAEIVDRAEPDEDAQ